MATVATSERVRIAHADHVADVRLVRADRHNALDWPMFAALDEALEELRSTRGLRAVVLSGEGPSFCSGLDFPSFMGGETEVPDLFAKRDGDIANVAQRVTYDWQRLPVPVVAALHGHCIGGGCQLALGADIRIAAPGTRLSIKEIDYGLIPDMGITQTLPKLVGMDVAKELTFTGRTVEAEEAVALGLVTRVAEDPLAAASELAREIASKSPDAVRAAKRLLSETWDAPAAEALAHEERAQRALLGSPNQVAAVTAAFAKAPGEFEDPEPA
ncbi:MAG: crotonase/enoyl-CoA hydratase family protein [Solirubrobacteraceae bacterium]